MNKSVDYIIVGLGIAGLSFCEIVEKNNKTFVVIDEPFCSATRVSAGIINPMVLKRFTPVWNAKIHTQRAAVFYKNLEKKLDTSFFKQLPMFRLFTSFEEQNNWMVASDKNELSTFLHPEIINNTNPCINAPFGMGKVNFSGVVSTNILLNSYQQFLINNRKLLPEKFKHRLLQISNNRILYKDIQAKHIVFAEGFSARNNPFFKKELIIPNKGEFLIIHSPKLKLNAMLKTSLFVVPLGNDNYKIGATYNREDFSLETTQSARETLLSKLKKSITCHFTIVNQVAGMRPTTLDRRPLLGDLPKQNNIFFFTGLGTRGIMSAPTLAQKLFDYIENKIPLEKEIDIKRRC